MVNILKKIGLILFFSLIYSIGLQFFIIPAGLLSTGFSGIAQIIDYFSNLTYSTIYILINIPGIIISYKYLGKKFTVFTMISVLTVSLTTHLLTTHFYNFYFTDDIILNCIFGGILMGYGIGGMLKIGSSTGGTDIIGLYFLKIANIGFSKLNSYINITIVLFAMIVFNFEIGLYTLLCVFARNLTMKYVFTNNDLLTLFIVGDHLEEIYEFIHNNLHRGTTLIKGTGGFTANSKDVILSNLNQNEYHILLNKINNSEENVFITVLDTKAIQGNYNIKKDN